MKRVMVCVLMMLCLFNTGCVMTGAKGEAYDVDKKVTTEIGFWRASLFTVTAFEDAEFDYGNVKLKLTKYKNKGDVEMMSEVSELVIFCLATYSSFGSFPTTLAIIEAFKSGKAQKIVSKINNGEVVTKADFEGIDIASGVPKK
jgi:hypothetical protein